MGVENRKSATITGLDAIPVELARRHFQGGIVRCVTESMTTTDGDLIGSTYRLNRVHSSWLFVAMAVTAGNTGGASKIDIGFYETARNGGAVVVADCLKEAQATGGSTTDTGWVQQAQDGGIGAVKYLWEIAGLSSDPNKPWDLVATVVNEAFSAALSIRVNLYFTDGS